VSEAFDHITKNIDAQLYDVPGKYKDYDHKEWRRLSAEKKWDFRRDLEKAYGLTDHPKADTMWRLAWEEGHSEGYAAVLRWYDDLYDLVKP
jgi:hypothetical protein